MKPNNAEPKVHFRARTDWLFNTLLGSTLALMVFVAILPLTEDHFNYGVIFAEVLTLAVTILLVWIWTGTSYAIDSRFIYYQSGPIRGKIKLESVRELVPNKTLWVGTLKPALARNGIIIKYNRYDEIYISPASNEEFIRVFNEMKQRQEAK